MRDFNDLFAHAPTHAAEAHGRVNLMGDHTDYNGGHVLPSVIPQKTRVELAASHGKQVRAWSTSAGGEPAGYTLGAEAHGHGWLDYVQGVTYALRKTGHEIGGFDARFESDVPPGAGVASSAALEVALLRGLRRLFDLPLDDVSLAGMGKLGENDIVGAPVGLMDQLAASLGQPGVGLCIDLRRLAIEEVPIPDDFELLVVDSGHTHAHAGGEYKQRRQECDQAAHLLGVEFLCDVDPARAPLGTLPEPLARRVRHVLSEDQRVLATADALRARDVAGLRELFDASQRSLRDDFQVSIPPIDQLIELARQDEEVIAARMTGGGFGGCVVILTRRGQAASVGARLLERYARAGGHGRVLVPQAEA